VRSIRTPGIAIAVVLVASVVSAATYTVTNTNDSGAGSLRQAITDANGTPGVADTIAFNIPGSGVHTITPATPLPTITDAITIDGYTQPGSIPNTNGPGLPDNSVHLIEIDGTNTGGGNGAAALIIQGSFTFDLRGLVINRAPGSGIFIITANGVVEGCFVGVDPTGLIARSNTDGVLVESATNVRVGGELPSERNVISANTTSQLAYGCLSAGGSGHVVQGNFLGPDATGAAIPLPISPGNQRGIALCFNVADVTIGGSTAAARNIISGNTFIGVDISNSFCGSCVTGIKVQGNYIGSDLTGTLPLANLTSGIRDNTIGNDILDNLISGNAGDGVLIESGSPTDGARVQGNKIGTDAAGLQPLPNAGWGLDIFAGGLLIGGTAPGEGNVIAYNGAAFQGGVFIGSGVGNAIRGNSIHDNVGLGIDLSTAGVTANDEGDGDTGPNNLQNFPVLATVTPLAAPTGGTHVQGVLHSAASTVYNVDFFSNDACVRFPKDFLEGRTYLGSDTVTTDAFGEGPIDTTLPTSIAPGERISMTATDPAGNTSEFSQRLPFAITPASGPSAGGTGVAIAGTDFEGPATVTVGGQPATNIVVVDFNHITATTPALAAGAVYDLTVTIPEGVTGTLEKGWVADFLDVPPANQFYSNVTVLVSNAITAGVGGGLYGVDNNTLRQQMAVFLLKGKHGLCYTPPPCVGTFPDVPCPSTFADWIEALATEGITGGCGGGNYCPQNPVRRDQMAVFLLKAEHGSSYLPPTCVGTFPDVPCPSQFADWIEQLAAESITGGCGGGNYCPSANNTRGQMAVFIVKTFKLQ
jgi:IPT/TIG domain/S-layer homology domain